MLIERIDVYWVRVPLAFVWRTSYADQADTDTLVVGWRARGSTPGASCPPYIPAYSAEHTLATYHTVREHLAPELIGQEIHSAQALLDRIDFVKGNQFARARAGDRLVGARGQAAGRAAARGARRQGGPRWRWAPTSASRTRSTS